MGDLFMEKTNKEETKPILCYGKDFSGYLKKYLKFVGVEVVPLEASETDKFSIAEFHDSSYDSFKQSAYLTRDDEGTIKLQFRYQNIKISDNFMIVDGERDANPYTLSFPIKRRKNGGFALVVERSGEYCDNRCVVITVDVDMLNNIDISVGTSEDIADYKMRIPVGKSEYGDAAFYLNSIFSTLSVFGIHYYRGQPSFYKYDREQLKFLGLAISDPRLLSKLDVLIKKIPSDIRAAFDTRKAEIGALAQKKIDAANIKRASDVEELTAIRDTALKLQDEALTSIDYLEGRRLGEYMDALEGARTGDTK